MGDTRFEGRPGWDANFVYDPRRVREDEGTTDLVRDLRNLVAPLNTAAHQADLSARCKSEEGNRFREDAKLLARRAEEVAKMEKIEEGRVRELNRMSHEVTAEWTRAESALADLERFRVSLEWALKYVRCPYSADAETWAGLYNKAVALVKESK